MAASPLLGASRERPDDSSFCARYFSCSYPCFEWFSGVVRPWNHIKVGRGLRAARQPGQLQGCYPELLRNGKLFTALVLATNFSEKYKGRDMMAQDVAEVRLPCELGLWRMKLVARCGFREATPFIWLGDGEVGDNTLYVAFGPLRTKSQYFKIIVQGAHLVDDEVEERDGQTWHLKNSWYVKEKLDHLWALPPGYDFGTTLAQVAADYPKHRIIFCGISHGAALAQAAALRFALKEPTYRDRVHVAVWNAYKWTDKEGSAVADRIFGDRSMHLVLSSRPLIFRKQRADERMWDSVTEFPPGFSPLPGSLLLDRDTGEFFQNVENDNALLGVDCVVRAMHLHFAKAAIGAMKHAMVGVRAASDLAENEKDSKNSHLDRISSRIESLRRSVSSSSNQPAEPTVHLDLFNECEGEEEPSMKEEDAPVRGLSRKERLDSSVFDSDASPALDESADSDERVP